MGKVVFEEQWEIKKFNYLRDEDLRSSEEFFLTIRIHEIVERVLFLIDMIFLLSFRNLQKR